MYVNIPKSSKLYVLFYLFIKCRTFQICQSCLRKLDIMQWFCGVFYEAYINIIFHFLKLQVGLVVSL